LSRFSTYCFRLGLNLGLCLCLLLCSGGKLHAEEPDHPFALSRVENVSQVILGILSYTRWPGDPSELQLCVTAPTEYVDHLIAHDFNMAGRHIVTRRVAVNSESMVTNCHAVYIGLVSDSVRAELFARFKDKAVLTISEQNDSCSVGSMFCLQFNPEGDVTFLVNLDTTARSTLRIHPNVLRLGKRRDDG